jgi:hypothetical protein
MADEDVQRIEVRAQTVEELRAFLDGSNLDLGCRPAVRREAGELVVDVYATMTALNGLRAARSAAGVRLTVVENATEIGRARQAEVGRGNRFATRQAVRGLGIKE